MTRRAIAILAKTPVPGQVKTRLSPPLSLEQAAALSASFLRDVLLAACGVAESETTLVVPEGAEQDTMAGLAPGDVSFLKERGRNLGETQSQAISTLLGSSHQPVVLIGADLPTISPSDLNDAFHRLESGKCDVVLGPATDGGYYLMGLNEPHHDLFRDIDWSTERVLAQTMERAKAANLTVELLPELSDVDTYSDLEKLIHELGMNGDIPAPATRLQLQRLRADGAPIPATSTPWTLLESEIEIETPWRSMLLDRVRTHSGDVLDWRYMKAPDPVIVVPVTRDGDIVLIRQYRQPLRDWSLEVPAGTGEGSLEDVVRTELREEIGATEIGELEKLGSWYPMTGHSSTLAHFYVALGVEPGNPQLERNELMVSERVPARIAFDMARRGEITDALCALALLRSESRIREWLNVS